MSQNATVTNIAIKRDMTYMSIQGEVARRVEDEKLFRLKSYEFEVMGLGQDELPCTMYVSPDILEVVTPPFADTVDGERMGQFYAWLEGFMQGGELSVAEDPDHKPPETMLARVHSVEDEFWAIRVTDPEETPGIRSFGAFSDKDEFVALTWEKREIIDDKFDEAVDDAIDAWMELFTETPHRGDSLDDYLTTYRAV